MNTIFILILFSVLTGMAAVVSLVLLLTLKKGKSATPMLIVVLTVSIVACIGFGLSAIYTTIDKTTTAASDLALDLFDSGRNIPLRAEDDRSYLLYSNPPNAQIERLKSYLPDSLKGKDPNSFYTYFGTENTYRYPLIYPYSLIANEYYWISVYNERSAKGGTQQGGKKLPIPSFDVFTFDKNLFITQFIDYTNPKEPQNVYVIFHFHSEKIETFSNEKAFLKRAKKLNFHRPDSMITVSEYDDLFH